MGYTPQSRDRYKSLVALTTGVVTFGSFAATGLATGLAARQTAQRDQQRAETEATAAGFTRAAAARAVQPLPWTRHITLVKRHPARTVVRTHVVHQVTHGGAASVGSGGSVTSAAPPSTYAPPASSSGGSSSSSSSHSSPPPPPPPPPRPPAPSSGS